MCEFWVDCISGSLLLLHGQVQAAGPEDGCFGCGVVFLGLVSLFFLVSVYSRLGFPRKLTPPGRLAHDCCRSDQMHQLRGSHQASIFGHDVEEASLLQEVGWRPALSDFSFVQYDHPAGRGDADMSGREAVDTSCPRKPTWASPCFGQAPNTFC